MPANGDRPTKTAPPSDSRRQAQTRSQGAGTKTVTALSNEELTKAFLIHEEELSLLQAGLKNLRQGEPHPDSSCSVAVATLLLHEVTKGNPPANIDKAEYKRFLKVVDSLINITTAKTKLANEVVRPIAVHRTSSPFFGLSHGLWCPPSRLKQQL
eukprot:s519_g33.t2